MILNTVLISILSLCSGLIILMVRVIIRNQERNDERSQKCHEITGEKINALEKNVIQLIVKMDEVPFMKESINSLHNRVSSLETEFQLHLRKDETR